MTETDRNFSRCQDNLWPSAYGPLRGKLLSTLMRMNHPTKFLFTYSGCLLLPSYNEQWWSGISLVTLVWLHIIWKAFAK